MKKKGNLIKYGPEWCAETVMLKKVYNRGKGNEKWDNICLMCWYIQGVDNWKSNNLENFRGEKKCQE